MLIFVGDRNAYISQYKAEINLHPGAVPHLSFCPVTIYYLRGRRLPDLPLCSALQDPQGEGHRRESVKASVRWHLCCQWLAAGQVFRRSVTLGCHIIHSCPPLLHPRGSPTSHCLGTEQG